MGATCGSKIVKNIDKDTETINDFVEEPEIMNRLKFVPSNNFISNINQYFNTTKILGRGVSCIVSEVQRISDGRFFACKSLNRSDEWSMLLFETEVVLLEKVNHEHVIKIEDVFVDKDNYHILTNMCNGGDLFTRIKQRKKFTENEAKPVIRSILSAVAHLHEKRVAHRDLKPENVVFDKLNDDTSLRIIDFGDAARIKPTRIYEEFVGTPCYLSPERLEKHTGAQLSKSDIWACGVILYEMLTGKRCFYGKSTKEVFSKIKDAQFKWPKHVSLSSFAKDFITKMITVDWETRFSAAEALKHPWIKFDICMVDEEPDNWSISQPISLSTPSQSYSFVSWCEGGRPAILQTLASRQNETKLRNILLKGRNSRRSSISRSFSQSAELSFMSLDRNHDGFVTFDDLVEYLKETTVDESLARFCAQIMLMELDIGRDGKIDLREYTEAYIANSIFNDDQFLRKEFKRIDMDHDGFISAEDIALLFNNCLELSVIQKLILEVDIDKDGKLSFAEFCLAMKSGTVLEVCCTLVSNLLNN